MKSKTAGSIPSMTSTSSYGRPQASNQPSRKGRKAWRKNTDLGQVEESLEHSRAQERVGLGTTPLSNLDDATLFYEDRAGDGKMAAAKAGRKAKKPLKSLEILSMRSAVPALASRVGAGKGKVNAAGLQSANAQQQTARLAGLPKKTRERLRRLAGKTVKGPFGSVVESEQGSALRESGPVETAIFDAWDQQERKGKGKGKRAAADDALEDDWVVDDPRHKKPKVPRTIAVGNEADPVFIARTLSALPVPDAGQSYNPTIESHEALLQQAYELALSKEQDEEKAVALKSEFERRRRRLNEEDESLFDDVSGQKFRTILGMRVDEPVDDDEADEEAEKVLKSQKTAIIDDLEEPVKKDPKRKTKTQRAKAQRHKDEVARAAARRSARQERALLSSLPSIRKSLRATEAARAQAAQLKAAARIERLKTHGLVGERARVGKYRVMDGAADTAHDEVQLAEELADGLRSVKPQGNHFRDRFQRLQARGLTEARQLVRPSRPKRANKAYERHSYKRFV